MDSHLRTMTRVIQLIGVILYCCGTFSFVGISAAFFMFRMFDLSTETRLAFIVLFFGLFATFQGLIFILIARGRVSRHEQMSYLIDQIRALSDHSSPPKIPDPPGIAEE